MSRRILFVTLAPPYPPHWGAAMRNYQLIKGLARRHRVALLTLVGPNADPEAIPHMREFCDRVWAVPLPAGTVDGKRGAQLRSLFSRQAYGVSKASTPELAQKLDESIAAFAPDLIQVEGSPLAHLPYPIGTPVLLDEHNIDYEVLARMAATERSPIRKLYNGIESLKFRTAETAAWRRSSAVTFTSDRELRIARPQAPGVAMATIPNGVDLDQFKPSYQPVDPDSIVFTGIQSYRPNSDGALYFATRILPGVVRKRPSSVFWIVGQKPPEELKRLEGPQVRVTGWVQDTATYLAKAAVVVAPLRMGGGTRLKILEALAMGKAVVTTSLGCEGLDVTDWENVLIADEPAAFGELVATVLADPELGARLGRNGRRLVSERYGWGAIAEALENFHAELAGVTR